jgi:SAM-dependent methyltransferase
MSPRLFWWIAVKNAVHPFRRLITRRLRRQHERFDRQAGVCTVGTVTVEALGLSALDSHRYDATPISFFRSLLGKLVLDYANTVFIDLGCGKGRTLLLASDYPFRAIIGVELSRELCDMAMENVKAYCSRCRKCSNISVHCQGIEDFEYSAYGPSDHLLVYLFNPCGEAVLRAGLQKIYRVVARGGMVTIVYVNPTCRGVLEESGWLEQVRQAEVFDETGDSFMPYVVFQSSSAEWSRATEQLAFQIGPWVLAQWKFRSLSNRTSPVAHSGRSFRPPVLQPVTFQTMPDDGTVSRALSIDNRAIRYVPYRGRRFFIDLSSGSFADYLNEFSSNTRNRLKRQLRHLIQRAGGPVDVLSYTSPHEIIEFREHAIAVSRVSYQSKIGWGFPESEEYKAYLISEAAKGRLRGYILKIAGKPISYGMCRTETDIITYLIIGYDPEYRQFSPGTILLLRIIEALFVEHRFRRFDLGGHTADYKAFHATGSIDYLRVIWMPITAKNLALVGAHWISLQAWRGASSVKTICTSTARWLAGHLSAGRAIRRRNASGGSIERGRGDARAGKPGRARPAMAAPPRGEVGIKRSR